MDLYANVTEYLIKGLKPSTSYIVSVLAYTVGDGPRSIHLTGATNDERVCKCMNRHISMQNYVNNEDGSYSANNLCCYASLT